MAKRGSDNDRYYASFMQQTIKKPPHDAGRLIARKTRSQEETTWKGKSACVVRGLTNRSGRLRAHAKHVGEQFLEGNERLEAVLLFDGFHHELTLKFVGKTDVVVDVVHRGAFLQ
ncbi:hypothetical protein GSY71_00030 [Pusillimonas sp. TS35]|uniref:hypothetical protein n=1 Tax=Paracandidimonas lactea TaxID=2895524 RepID=UPI00136D04D5|nr:hypothetical protein [Paracandidimonas lactea]MYN11546.1 hypothetical protein [Pusillimonas sp. TS35]